MKKILLEKLVRVKESSEILNDYCKTFKKNPEISYIVPLVELLAVEINSLVEEFKQSA